MAKACCVVVKKCRECPRCLDTINKGHNCWRGFGYAVAINDPDEIPDDCPLDDVSDDAYTGVGTKVY